MCKIVVNGNLQPCAYPSHRPTYIREARKRFPSCQWSYRKERLSRSEKTSNVLRAQKSYIRRRKEVVERATHWRRFKRLETIIRFGAKCLLCGYDKFPEILQLHHINGSGRNECTLWAASKNPKLFELLCPNCHRLKSLFSFRKLLPSRLDVLRHLNRIKAISRLNGKCVSCSTRNHQILDFDHIIPRFSSGYRKTTRNEQEMKRHPERFQLLCANCHWIKTFKQAGYNKFYDYLLGRTIKRGRKERWLNVYRDRLVLPRGWTRPGDHKR